MLFVVLDQLRSEPTNAVFTLLAFTLAIVAAITVHEFSHALSANLLGDSTAKNQGRLTLNPLAHLDPAGTIMIVVVGFGWGRPTPVNPARFGSHMRSGMAAVSFAGPISNVIVASLCAIPVKIGLLSPGIVGFSIFGGEPGGFWAYLLGSLIFINILLAAFNLIPVAPLDGFKVVQGLLPRDTALQWSRLERWGPLILMVLVLSGFILPTGSLLVPIMRPLVNVLAMIIIGGQIWG
ncbi:MAG: site-2 protease family protein [Dehalococcoidia bacterium]|nr:site-2 protease family protein [Dehalococcoidia bacterium]